MGKGRGMRNRHSGLLGAGLASLSLALGACNLLPKGIVATASGLPSDAAASASAIVGAATPKPTATPDSLSGSVIFGSGATPTPAATTAATQTPTPTPTESTTFVAKAVSISIAALATDSIGVPPPNGASPLRSTTMQVTADAVLNDFSHTSDVNWSSSDSGIAGVSNSGLVTAVAKGQATITATAKQSQLNGNPATASVKIIVIDTGDADLTVQ